MIHAPSRGTSDRWNSRRREKSVCSPDALLRTLPRPTDTSPPDCGRVGEGMATSHAQGGSCVRNVQTCDQQKRGSMSPTTLTREIQSGSGSSCSTLKLLSFRAKSRNLVAEQSARATGFFDSAPLRSERPTILENGYDTSGSSVCRHRSN